jgi:hypothetical protein
VRFPQFMQTGTPRTGFMQKLSDEIERPTVIFFGDRMMRSFFTIGATAAIVSVLVLTEDRKGGIIPPFRSALMCLAIRVRQTTRQCGRLVSGAFAGRRTHGASATLRTGDVRAILRTVGARATLRTGGACARRRSGGGAPGATAHGNGASGRR